MPKSAIEAIIENIESFNNEEWHSERDKKISALAKIAQTGYGDITIIADTEGISLLINEEVTKALEKFLRQNRKAKIKLAFNQKNLEESQAHFPDGFPLFSALTGEFGNQIEIYSISNDLDKSCVVVDNRNLFFDGLQGDKLGRFSVTRMSDPKLAKTWTNYFDEVSAKGVLISPKAS